MAKHEYVCPLCMGAWKISSVSAFLLREAVKKHDLEEHGLPTIKDMRGER